MLNRRSVLVAERRGRPRRYGPEVAEALGEGLGGGRPDVQQAFGGGHAGPCGRAGAAWRAGVGADGCEERGYHVGGHSAYRVMKRVDPAFHATVPHECKLDRRAYP